MPVMHVEKTLVSIGLKITTPRKKVLGVLLTSKKPLSAEEILYVLEEQRVEVDLASIYRTLNIFEDKKIVEAIDFSDGKKRFEVISEAIHHHHHMVCKKCGDIQDVELEEEEELIKKIEKETQFKIDKHQLEFFGWCVKCQ